MTKGTRGQCMAAAAEILDVCLPKKPRNVLISLQL